MTLLDQLGRLEIEIRRLREVVQRDQAEEPEGELVQNPEEFQRRFLEYIGSPSKRTTPYFQPPTIPVNGPWPKEIRNIMPDAMAADLLQGQVESVTYHGIFDGVPFYTPRANGWSKLRVEFLNENPKCFGCESIDQCVPHHIVPVHVDPSLELVKDNLVTACPTCHFLICHCKDWRSWNPFVEEDLARVKGRIMTRPYKEVPEK